MVCRAPCSSELSETKRASPGTIGRSSRQRSQSLATGGGASKSRSARVSGASCAIRDGAYKHQDKDKPIHEAVSQPERLWEFNAGELPIEVRCVANSVAGGGVVPAIAECEDRRWIT